MIYLDSAAVVKLVHAEPESPALRTWLDERSETGWTSSVLVEIEIEDPRSVLFWTQQRAARIPATPRTLHTRASLSACP